MSGLALAQAPPSARPLRFLLTAPLWGIAAGLLLCLAPEVLALGRWAPATVALVHVFTLGVLGNAMLGSLAQFLPVAAGTPVPGAAAAPWLHAALNLGLLLLLAGLYRWPAWLPAAGLLLAGALAGAVLPLVPPLLRHGAQRLLRAGLAAAVLALLATAMLGALAAAVLGGWIALPLDRLADAHGSLGAAGWLLGLLAAVGAVTVPMFQGTHAVPPRALRLWLWAMCGLPGPAALARLAGAPALVTALAIAAPALAFAGGVLWLQWRAPHRRNLPLVRAWRAGCVAMALGALAACVAAAGAPASVAVLAGALGLGIGVPLLVNSMLLEVVAFITWIALRGRCPRGVRIPAVGRLVTDAQKLRALYTHLAAGGLLAAAVYVPALAVAAGLALGLAYAMTAGCLLLCLRRARLFARDHPDA